MSDRVGALGGELQVTGTPGTGTLVRGAVPTAGPTARSFGRGRRVRFVIVR